MSQLEILKRLETMIAFQQVCLAQGNWDEFDRAENEVKKLEADILNRR